MAKQLINHISLRVPWHDDKWRGTVCENPIKNLSCRKLKSIAEEKDEELEEAHKASFIEGIR